MLIIFFIEFGIAKLSLNRFVLWPKPNKKKPQKLTNRRRWKRILKEGLFHIQEVFEKDKLKKPLIDPGHVTYTFFCCRMGKVALKRKQNKQVTLLQFRKRNKIKTIAILFLLSQPQLNLNTISTYSNQCEVWGCCQFLIKISSKKNVFKFFLRMLRLKLKILKIRTFQRLLEVDCS